MRASTATPLLGRLWPTFANTYVLKALTMIAGSLLLWASAKVSVPFWPVPMTMQVFAVLLLGLGLGAPLAVAAVGLYLAQGAMGLPVFQGTPEKGLGLVYMAGPTGGLRPWRGAVVGAPVAQLDGHHRPVRHLGLKMHEGQCFFAPHSHL